MAGVDTYGKPPTLRELLAKTRPAAGGCRLWTGATNGKGYPVVRAGGKLWLAHRLVYKLAHGAIKAGQVIDQTCNTPLCCAPAHLEAKTQQANIARAGARGAMDRP